MPQPDTTLHVIFTAEGIPGHISDDPRPGSELIAGLDLDFLIAHRRTEKGEWVAREPKPDTGPTPEELAEREAEAAALAEEAAKAREAEILRRALPDMHLRSSGLITIAEYKARYAQIAAEVEAGG